MKKLILAITCLTFPAIAQTIHIGVVASLTGPAASLGIPQRNSVALLPPEVAGHKVEYIVLDDATDPTKAVSDARKLIDENNVDAIIGSSTTPASLAMITPVALLLGRRRRARA